MNEPTTVGLSTAGHSRLKRLCDEQYFRDMRDAYRFAIAYAIAHGQMSTSGGGNTIYNVGTLDTPDKSIYWAIKALHPDANEPIYHLAERLAEWGLEQLSQMADNGDIPFRDILEEAETMSPSQQL